MEKKIAVAVMAALAAALPHSAVAGFDSWTAEVESDPFSKKTKVIASYMESVRSGVLVFCDGGEHAVRIRAIPGYVWTAAMDGFEPTFQVAVDGELVYTGTGRTGFVGDNLATAEITLERAASDQFVAAFVAAKKQIAIKDGMSDTPQLLSARGSTKAGQALARCLAESP